MNHHTLRPARGRSRDPAREQSWRQSIRRFTASGQSVRAFCSAHRLKATAFYFWRREIQRRDGRLPAGRQRATAQPLTFARLVVDRAGPLGGEPGLCLRLGGGRELLLPAAWPTGRLAALVRAIEGQPSEDAP